MAEFIRTSGISHYIESIIINARKELFLVTPYLQLSPNFYERLSDANRNDITINLIYGKSQLNRKEQQQVNSLKNLRLYFFDNLHAKCYFNEKEMVITSMNLYEFSEKNNREMGVYLNANQDTDLYQDAKKETESIINNAQLIKDVSSLGANKRNVYQNKQNYAEIKPQLGDQGFCIRCSDTISMNPYRPLCYTCFDTWKYFSNGQFPEKVCHICGDSAEVCFDFSVCKGCYSTFKKEIKEMKPGNIWI